MQNTPNYNYNLPEYSDSADIAVLNANFSSIDANEYRIEGKLNALGNDIALPYDNTATYSVGDYVIYNNALYRCITAIATAEDFDSTKWTAITIGGELKSHDTRISTLEAGVDLEKSATNSFDDGIDSYFKKVESSIVPIQAGSGTPSPTNVRPITGFTECAVLDISDSTNASYFMGLLTGTYGFVDLGALDWAYQSNIGRMNCTSTIPNIKAPASNSSAFNGISPKYQSVGALYIDNNCMAVNTDGELRIKDNDYTDASTFKTAMSGVYLVYELETPTTPTITDAQMQTLLAKFGYTGTTATISFGSAGTVYGGYVDLISGKLVVEKVEVDLGTLNWVYDTSWGSGADNRNTFRTVPNLPIKNVAGSEISDIIADRYSTVSANQLYQGGNLSVAQNASYIRIRNTAYTDATLFKTAMSGAQLVYPLATPQEYQLTPAQLRSLVGANRLTSSTGEVTEVEYITNETIAWLLDLIRA